MAPPDDRAEAVTDGLLATATVWRVRWLLAAAFTLIALVATARAERRLLPKKDPRPALAAQLAAESEAIAKALATVTSKLAEADAIRARRLAAAYRLIRDARPARGDLAAIRRRAAAQLLVQRDHAERTLLADEARHLEQAAARVAGETAALPAVVMPVSIGRPARGAIARKFGSLVHDKSKATLSRRGIDFDVEARSEALAPNDGVVRFAGPIRGLDEGVVIDHGDHYSVVAKLADLVIPVGAKVVRGDRIGRAARQRIYLEVRVKLAPGGLPIDPEPLLEDPPRKR
jgi:septal ring factor EnvC (AmiA/AmiB activator)